MRADEQLLGGVGGDRRETRPGSAVISRRCAGCCAIRSPDSAGRRRVGRILGRAPAAQRPCTVLPVGMLKLRDENGPRLAVQVPLFPEAAFPADTLAASENRSGLYLESNGIFEMVRNLVRNTDDVRHPYITPLNAESHAGLPPRHPGHQRIRPAARRRPRLRPQARRSRKRPDLRPQPEPHPRVPAVHPLLSRLPPGHPRAGRPHQDQDRLTPR